MNNHVFLLLEGGAAKRKLAQLFQSEGLGQANHSSTAIATRESIPAVQTDIEEASKPFRENRREHGLVRSGSRTALRAIQPGQMKRDLTVSGFVFALVLAGAILAVAVASHGAQEPLFKGLGAVARAAKGDVAGARKEQAIYLKRARLVPNDEIFGNNTAKAILGVVTHMLEGEMVIS